MPQTKSPRMPQIVPAPSAAGTAAGRRALVVAGVHRSGTSALTRTLSLLGGALAADLLGAVPGNNERGFWEPKAVVELHDRALASAGSAWDDVSCFPDTWFESDVARRIGDELAALIESEFALAPLFAIKDPRVCRLVPLWLSVLRRLRIQAHFVLPLRNPAEVAGSLNARDGFPMAKGYLLWLRNALDAELATRGRDRVFVTYEALLDDWRAVVDRIGEALAIRWPRLSRTAEAEIEDFLSTGLRHQQFAWEGVRQRRDVPGWVVSAYDALLRLSAGEKNAETEIDAVREELDRADLTYGRALAGVGLRLDEALALLRERDAEASAAAERHERLKGELHRLNDGLVRQQETSWRLQEDLTVAQGEITRLTQALSDQRMDFEGRIEAILGSTSWRMTAPARHGVVLLRKLRSGGRGAAAWALPLLSRKGYVRLGRVAKTLLAMPLSPGLKVRLAWALRHRHGRRPTAPPWQGDVLATLPPPAAAQRVLVVDRWVPTPDMDSGSYRMTRILFTMTDAGVPVDFAGDLPFSQPRYRKALEEKGIRVFIGREALLSHLQAHGMEYRVVILSRPEVAHDYLPIVRAFALNARVLYDTVDLHWVRFTRAGQVLTDIAGLSERAADYRRLEMANARCADVTIAITGEERDALLAEAPDLDVTVLPNIHEVPPRVAPFRERRDLLFIGGFSHEPNVDAVHYFVSHILPYVTVKLPKVRFRILGSNMPASIRKLASPQVDPVGFVPEVEPYFDRARIFVAPLRHGAGMKGKVGQSLSFGLPVVTTSVGAEGMGLVDGENALVSDEPEGFAERILRLYDNQELWTRLSAAGRDVIVSRFSEEAMRPQVLALVGAAGPVLPNAEPRTQAVA